MIAVDDRIRAPQSEPTRRAFRSRSSAKNRKIRFRVFQRDGFRCVYCGIDLLQSIDALLTGTVDHVKPLVDGGKSDDDNLVTACTTCNSLKAGTTGLTLAQVRVVVARRRRELIDTTLAELERLGVRSPEEPAIV